MSAAPPSNGSVDKWVEITKVGYIILKSSTTKNISANLKIFGLD